MQIEETKLRAFNITKKVRDAGFWYLQIFSNFKLLYLLSLKVYKAPRPLKLKFLMLALNFCCNRNAIQEGTVQKAKIVNFLFF